MSGQDKEAIDVGYEIAKLLLDWRPEMGHEDVATAIMQPLERYSIDNQNSNESELRTIFGYLERMIEERERSF